MPARMMVFATIKPGEEKAFEDAFQNEPSRYILLSEWESTEAVLAWEDAPIHMQTTTPMRPYWAGRVERRMYEVAVRLYS